MKLPYSLNGRIVLEPYKKEELKAELKNGFALIHQKKNLKGLKVLVDFELVNHKSIQMDGLAMPQMVSKGDTVYIKEEVLHNHPSVKMVLSSDAIEGDFIILDASLVEFVVPKEGI